MLINFSNLTDDDIFSSLTLTYLNFNGEDLCWKKPYPSLHAHFAEMI